MIMNLDGKNVFLKVWYPGWFIFRRVEVYPRVLPSDGACLAESLAFDISWCSNEVFGTSFWLLDRLLLVVTNHGSRMGFLADDPSRSCGLFWLM